MVGAGQGIQQAHEKPLDDDLPDSMHKQEDMNFPSLQLAVQVGWDQM